MSTTIQYDTTLKAFTIASKIIQDNPIRSLTHLLAANRIVGYFQNIFPDFNFDDPTLIKVNRVIMDKRLLEMDTALDGVNDLIYNEILLAKVLIFLLSDYDTHYFEEGYFIYPFIEKLYKLAYRT